jgi:hypothetical protein
MKSLKRHLTSDTVMLYAFAFVAYTAGGLYSMSRWDTRGLDLLTRVGLLYVVGYWLAKDSRRRSFHLPYCLGMFLLATWVILLPYYLFKTRGARAIIPVALYLATLFFSTALGAVLAIAFFGAKLG